MSSKGRAAEDYKADPNGFFETQSQVTRAGATLWGIQPGMVILEPGCGNGAIAKVLRRMYGASIIIIGIEIDKGRAKTASKSKTKTRVPIFDEVIHKSYFDVDPNSFSMTIDRVITNPSFSIWLKVAEHSFKISSFTSLLIPWNSCASMERAQWWLQHPARARVLSKRPSFAISVKCVHANGKAASAAGVELCSYQELIGLSMTPAKECPICGSPTRTTRSDSNEYSWTTWAPEFTSNTWDPLETPPPHPDDL
jgi:predicted RNA methylase